jgi:hypothetical protein
MGKKKREHIVFDQILKPKKNIPISKINRIGKNIRRQSNVEGKF